MARSAAYDDILLLDRATESDWTVATGARTLEVTATHRIEDVEAVWRSLTTSSIESPGQSIDFIRLWIKALGIAERDQFYVVAHLDGAPIALVPLQRRWDKGARVLSWFPGPHVGCNAPVVDVARLQALSGEDRRRLWIKLLRSFRGADVVYMKAVPQLIVDGVDLFAEMGQVLESDVLYRAAFTSFAEADRTQRNKSRRKHDRQQGDKLSAKGEVTFEEIENGPTALAVLETMFQQRAARFREMGVFDPFAIPSIREFYDSTARENSPVPIKLHLLRLNGEIVAVRYNIVHGDRLFCLISSMSDDPSIQNGSPGKQCLLRVMQTVFDQGYRVFDMGEGLTDEKRHWCNQQIPVRHHYVPITRRGAIAAQGHRGWHTLRRRIKSDEKMSLWAKNLRGTFLRLTGRPEEESRGPDQD
ncbi:MAG TPA: GNAT family N-acetyltransferase [Devosia sp.]|jgi:CelD/BcsL family acetyltransferase involved in cellulose biosynthesis|nr:GNAT family N-acetyltransferase [Devosia sp.]